jgi:predicted O-methyltransferase YrrM
MPPNVPKTAYMAVNRSQGTLLYLLACATRAQKIVEFGCSFGVSTLYLAAAARDAGGSVVTTEIEPTKCDATSDNLRRAGLGEFATVVQGDATKTLGDVDGPIDFVFLDGTKRLYVPVLSLLRPKLRPGAIVVADNADTPQARSYVEHVTVQADLVSVALFNGRTLVSYVS